MKAIIEYNNIFDGRRIYSYLAETSVKILKTKKGKGLNVFTKLTIEVDDDETLNRILSALNRQSLEEVRLVKVKGRN